MTPPKNPERLDSVKYFNNLVNKMTLGIIQGTLFVQVS